MGAPRTQSTVHHIAPAPGWAPYLFYPTTSTQCECLVRPPTPPPPDFPFSFPTTVPAPNSTYDMDRQVRRSLGVARMFRRNTGRGWSTSDGFAASG